MPSHYIETPSGSGKKGRTGKDAYVRVPCGTIVSEVVQVINRFAAARYRRMYFTSSDGRTAVAAVFARVSFFFLFFSEADMFALVVSTLPCRSRI